MAINTMHYNVSLCEMMLLVRKVQSNSWLCTSWGCECEFNIDATLTSSTSILSHFFINQPNFMSKMMRIKFNFDQNENDSFPILRNISILLLVRTTKQSWIAFLHALFSIRHDYSYSISGTCVNITYWILCVDSFWMNMFVLSNLLLLDVLLR